MKLLSSDIIYACEEQEFFYKINNLPVEEGDPIGFDKLSTDAKTLTPPVFDLVLFDDIYWSPQYDK
tara:strand:+ start:890 stop:1087 length:198 start_codon:yes stop_codon:yes gene_type:complete